MRRIASLLLLLGAGPALADGLDVPLRALVETVAAARDRHLDVEHAAAPAPLRAAITAFLDSFGDPATRYLTPEQWQGLERTTRGSFEGYGMVIASREGGFFKKLLGGGWPPASDVIAELRKRQG